MKYPSGPAMGILKGSARGSKRLLGALFALGLLGLSLLRPDGSLLQAVSFSTGSIRLSVTPRDIWPPATITDLSGLSGLTEGSVRLQWSAPYEDTVQIPDPNSAVYGYTVRYATYSPQTLGGDTTAWFNQATYNLGVLGGLLPGQQETPAIGGLEPGATFFFIVRSSDEVNNLSFLSAAATAQALDLVPGAPGSLTALSVLETSATVRWAAPSPNPGDLDFYRIFISSQTPAVWQATATVAAPTSNYIFTTLRRDVTYQFKVTVVDRGQPNYAGNAYESADSGTISARLKLVPPASLAAVNVTTYTITWQWTDNSTVEDGFRVYASSGGSIGTTGGVTGTGNTVWLGENNLTPGASYQRYVVTTEGALESDPSASVLKYTLPNPATMLAVSTATASSISLSWSANSNASGVRYIVRRDTFPSTAYVDLATTTATGYIDTASLQEGVTYTYELRAMNGEEAVSAALTLSTPTLIVKPAAVTSLAASQGAGEGEIALSWTAPGDDGTTGNISGGELDVRWSTNAIQSQSDFDAIPDTSAYRRLLSTNTVAGSGQGLLVTGLNFGTTVYFALRMRDETVGNYAALSNVVTAQLRITAPSAFAAVSATTGTITWQWTDNSLSESGFRILTSSGGLIGSTGGVTGSGNLVQWTEGGLVPGTSAQRYAAAFDNTQQSNPSNSAGKYTLANPPLALVSSTATTGSVTLAWSANNNGPLVSYVLERATYPSSSYLQIGEVTATGFLSSGLAEAATYTYRLSAKNGESVLSSPITLTTMTTTVPPSAVTSLAAAPGSQEGQILLSWRAPGDDATSGNIVGGQYDIRWSSAVIASQADFDAIPDNASYRRLISSDVVAGSDQGILLTGLQFNALVYFAMRTRDEVGGNYSSLSNVANSSVQTDVTAPATVTSLAAALYSSSSVRLTWIAPGDDGLTKSNQQGSYEVRYRTDGPISSLALFLGGQLVPMSSTSPFSPGLQESLVVSGLNYDTTYYFALRTQDEVPNVSGLSNGTSIYTPDLLAPDPVQNLTATANTTIGRRVDLAWKNPTTPDLKGVRILVRTDGYASLPTDTGAARFDLYPAGGLLVPPTTFAHTNLQADVTYYYSVFAFDDEAGPNFASGAFAQAKTVSTRLARPSRPRNLRGSRSQDGESFVMRWDPPETRVDGNALEPLEISSYSVLRMAKETEGTTNFYAITPASSGTYFTDLSVAKRILYYKVRAINVAGDESADSDILAGDGDVIVLMDDNLSYIKLPGEQMQGIYESGVELAGSRKTLEEGGRTFKAVNVEVRDRRNGEPRKDYLFDQGVQVSIGYLEDATGKVANGAPAIGFAQALPKASEARNAFSIYWYNGSQWIKLGTTVDLEKKTASVKTKHAGSYQLRLVQQGLDVQSNSVYPRTITPNGDGINDIVFFFYENPTDAEAKGAIYDMRSAKVAEVRKSDIFAGNNVVLTWDGKDDAGSVVSGGVYIYKIEIGDKTFTGTVAVAR